MQDDRRPIVHIGYHRTATTWFQQNFYPTVRNTRFIARKIARAVFIEPRAFAFSPARAREILEAEADGRRMLLCEENFSGYLHNGGLGGLVAKEVAQRIRQTLPDAQIVVFLRSQPRIIAASYAQYVLAGGTHSFSQYIHGQRRIGGATRHWYKAPGSGVASPARRVGPFGRQAVPEYCVDGGKPDAEQDPADNQRTGALDETCRRESRSRRDGGDQNHFGLQARGTLFPADARDGGRGPVRAAPRATIAIMMMIGWR